MKLKIGLIGFGSWVKSAYLPALEYDGRAKITAVTASTDKTKQFASQTLGEDVIIFDNYEELLNKATLDAVMIAVPDNIHQSALSAVLKTNIAVFYEPPISHIRNQIPVMIDNLLTAKQVTFANLELGFHPAIVHAKELIKSNTIGLLQRVTISLYANWRCKENFDLCLMDRMSCWYIDVMNKIMDSIPNRVMLFDGYGGLGRMQPVSTAVYDYNGIWGIFSANIGKNDGVSITIEISGTKGDINIDYFTGELKCCTTINSKPTVELYKPLEPYADYPCMRETITAFLNAVVSSDINCGNAKNVAQLNLIGLATEESKDTGNWANVKVL